MCQAKTCEFKIDNYNVIKDCTSLMARLKKQPVAVAVDASKWLTYSSGIFKNCDEGINHMVLLTGLSDDYWRCKNSFGTTWGEQGYIRLAPGNTCGICRLATFP